LPKGGEENEGKGITGKKKGVETTQGKKASTVLRSSGEGDRLSVVFIPPFEKRGQFQADLRSRERRGKRKSGTAASPVGRLSLLTAKIQTNASIIAGGRGKKGRKKVPREGRGDLHPRRKKKRRSPPAEKKWVPIRRNLRPKESFQKLYFGERGLARKLLDARSYWRKTNEGEKDESSGEKG